MTPGRAAPTHCLPDGTPRRLTLLAGILAIAAGISPATSAQPADQSANAEAIDRVGRPPALSAPATRVITLAPHLAELMYAAGAGPALIATVEYSDTPAAAANLPRIGDAFRFDLERILDLKPDLLIGWVSGNPEAALSRLESLGLPLWRVNMTQPSDMALVMELMAAAAGLPPPQAAASLREREQSLRARHAGKTRLRYFYQVAAQPLYTVNGQHLISRGLDICAADNVFADLDALAPQIDLEAVLAADPDVLIAGTWEEQTDPLAEWQQWPRLQAVRNEALLLLPADQIARATPRMLDAVETACNLLDAWRDSQPGTASE